MARDRRGTADESATVPGQREESAPTPDEARDSTEQAGGAQGGGPAGEPTTKTLPSSERPDATGGRPQPAAPKPGDLKIRHTRISGTWAAVVGFAVVLLLLLIFILQNGHTVDISYMGAHGHLPLGVALLLAAVAGILLVALAGSARIMQLRATARRHRRAGIKAEKAAAKAQR